MSKFLGKVVATLNAPTEVGRFSFWVADGKKDEVEVGYIVVAEESAAQKVYGLVTEIKSYTDVDGVLSDYFSHDFGNPDAKAPTSRQQVLVATTEVIGSSPLRIRPVTSGVVRLATATEVQEAYGMDEIEDPILCGVIPNGRDPQNFAPAFISEKFLIGPEGAHLNISGASGLATKTSAALFMLASLLSAGRKRTAVIALNVKSEDLMYLDRNTDENCVELLRKGLKDRKAREILSIVHDNNVNLHFDPKDIRISYFAPGRRGDFAKPNSLRQDKVVSFFWSLSELRKKESPLRLSALFDPTDIDDKALGVLGTIEDVLQDDWKDSVSSFAELVKEIPANRERRGHHSATVAKVRRLIQTVTGETLRGLFAFDKVDGKDIPVETIQPGDLWVVDIQALSDKGKRVVFFNIISRVANMLERQKVLKAAGENVEGLDNVVIFVDELNKFASSEGGMYGGLKQQVVEIAARGRSIGLVLFGAQQFASAIDKEVYGNCSTYIVGRTEFIELGDSKTYRWISNDLKYSVSTLPKGKLLLKHALFNRPVFIEFPRPLHTYSREELETIEEELTKPEPPKVQPGEQSRFDQLKRLAEGRAGITPLTVYNALPVIKKKGVPQHMFVSWWKSWFSGQKYGRGHQVERDVLELVVKHLESLPQEA